MEYLYTDYVQKELVHKRTSVLRRHELEMQDSIWDPFGLSTHIFEFLSVAYEL